MKILEQLSDQKKYYSQKELLALGLSYYRIKKMVSETKLRRINWNHYENLMFVGDDHEFYIVSSVCEEGVVCLMSAAVYHEFSTSRPFEIDVAIPRHGHIPKTPDDPTIRLFFFDHERYNTGIETVVKGENRFRIYNIEKTICDLLVYRNKFGLEESVGVLKNYLASPNRDLNKLIDYAEKLRCYPLLLKYLEVLL